MKTKKSEVCSPLKDKPLRYPGQSLDEEIQYAVDEEASPYIMIAVMVIVMTGLEWWRWYSEHPYQPWTWSVAALLVASFSIYKINKIRKKVRLLRQGRDGERAVGQYLESLRVDGCQVFHDITGDKFNIDHVLISEHGIYTVETKTFSKRPAKDATIRFDGESILVDSLPCKPDILTQVRAQAGWLRQLLKESTGKDFKVRPAAVFPGWYVESVGSAKSSDVWVLNPKGLPKFIENQPLVLSREDVHLASYHLSRYVRGREDGR